MRSSFGMMLVGALACSPQAREEGPAEARVIVAPGLGSRLDNTLMASAGRGFTGAALVESDGVIVLRKGYGSTGPDGAYPIQPDTYFFVASVTKGVTGAAILKLRDLGLLRLDQRLTEFFPDVPDGLRAATLGLVLTHRAGFGNNYGGTAIADRDSAVADIFSYPLAYPPGEGFLYSNDGYSLLAAVVEVVTGDTFESWVARNVLGPAGIPAARFWGHVEDRDPRVFAQKLSLLPDSIRSPNWAYRGSGGWAASVVDLHRWAVSVRDGRVVDPTELFGPHHVLASGTGIGYGWFKSETPSGGAEYWSRGGEDFGHNAVIRWFPGERILVIVQSNMGEFDGDEANRTVSDALVRIALTR